MAMLPVDAFREVQNESTEKLSQHLLALRKSMLEANKLHRKHMTILQHLVQSGGATYMCERAAEPESRKRNVINLDSPLVKPREPLLPETVSPKAKPHAKLDDPNSLRKHFTMHTTTDEPERPVLKRGRGSSLQDNLPMKVTRGFFLTWGTGFTGIRQILGYDIDRLVAFGAFPLTVVWGSIFRLRYSLLAQVIAQPMLIFFIALCTDLFSGRSDLLDQDSFEESAHGKSVKFINDALQRLVPFVLGLYVSLHLRRWWIIRSIFLQNIHTSSMLLSTKLGLVFPESFKRFKMQIERYLLAAHKMVFMCARQELQGNINYDSLLVGGILTREELQLIHEYIESAPEEMRRQIGGYDMAVAGIPLTWASQLIYRTFIVNSSRRYFDFSVNLMVQMIHHCVDCKKNILNIEMMLITPLPFPYAHLVTLVVHACCVCSCIEAGIFFGGAKRDWGHFLSGSVGVVVLNGLYLGLLSLTALLTNPFTEECVHFPAANYHCRMVKSQVFSQPLHYRMSDIDKDIVDVLNVEQRRVNERQSKEVLNDEQQARGNSEDEADDDDDDSNADDNGEIDM